MRADCHHPSERRGAAVRIRERRRGRDFAYWNAAIWAVGNGLVGSTLIVFMVQEIAGRDRDPRSLGLLIGWILAAPQLAGLLRTVTPELIALAGGRKRLCVAAYLVSTVFLFATALLPWVAIGRPVSSLLLWVAAAWCAYHLFEYVGTVSLWSWFRDLTPGRIRGRFIGRRERWLLGGMIPAMITAGLHTWSWHQLYPDAPRWTPYATCAACGAAIMVLAVVPIVRMPAVKRTSAGGWSSRARAFFEPLRDGPFRRLIFFGCWLSLANGVTQSAQGRYPYLLGMSFFFLLALRAGMASGQSALSDLAGRWVDRFGSRRIMIATLPIVALGPFFYFLAGLTPDSGGTSFGPPEVWVAAAWLVWVAYVGINVALPRLMLRLPAPGADGTAHIATYYAVTGLCYGLSTLLGGAVLDALNHVRIAVPGAPMSLDRYQFLLLMGWVLRTGGILLLLGVVRETPSEARWERT